MYAYHVPRTRGRQTRVAAAQLSTDNEVTKNQLIRQLEGLNRGIFGVQSEKQKAIHDTIAKLEAVNPTAEPTAEPQLLDGSWKLLYSTIRILGTKRSKLGLREFVQIGELYQDIDMARKTAVNRVEFNVSGFALLKGCLTITAGFESENASQVNVVFQKAELEPDQLEQLFQKNYDLLLEIFNPEGWLEVTYVDEHLRVGRDDKGHVFVLERC